MNAFFYGTLRQACLNHTRFFRPGRGTAAFVGYAKISGYEIIVNTSNGLPYVIESSPDKQVLGEVWDIDEISAANIARMELNSGYAEKIVTANVEDGPALSVPVYVKGNQSAGTTTPVQHGDYVRWLSERRTRTPGGHGDFGWLRPEFLDNKRDV